VSFHSHAYQAYLETVISGQERALVAEWLLNKFPGNPLIAVNAAGLIPYKTMMPTIDMLGLNDHHIARVTNVVENTGAKFVGHFKYDGEYICQLRPDVVILSGGTLYRGRNKQEAMLQSAANTFASDRAFLNSGECQGKYVPIADEVRTGQFVVVYTRQAESLTIKIPDPDASARTWFDYGIKLIGHARFIEAQQAFQTALSKDPLNPGILTNLAYTYFDTKQYSQAIEYFRRAISIQPDYYNALFGMALAYENAGYPADALMLWEQYVKDAPDSPWKEQAHTHIRLLKGKR
jgi:Flp pilus assembly protein TadD